MLDSKIVMNLYSTDTPKFENVPTSELEDLAKSLISKKIDIESQMDSIVARLNSDDLARIGLKKRLTDDEGFPLSGIDVHEVRTLRNRFATLSTDLNLILHEIEKSIHDIHEQARITGRVQPGFRGRRIPFGRVETVVPGSPAEEGGLLVGDRIVRFGNLCTISDSGVENCYDGIPEAIRGVSGSEYLDVEILRLGREEDDIIVRIQPRDGRVGCLIKPL